MTRFTDKQVRQAIDKAAIEFFALPSVVPKRRTAAENVPPEDTRHTVDLDSVPVHTRCIFDALKFPGIVDFIVRCVRAGKYDALAACGHSGIIAAGAAAYVCRIPILAVRKAGESPKGDSRQVNGLLAHGVKYAFVDDLIDSGGTLCRVAEMVQSRFRGHAQMSGIILYNMSEDNAKRTLEVAGSVDGVPQFATLPLHTRGDYDG